MRKKQNEYPEHIYIIRHKEEHDDDWFEASEDLRACELCKIELELSDYALSLLK